MPQLASDDVEDTALLARDEDAAWVLGVVAATPLVDIGPLDRKRCSAVTFLKMS